MSPEDVVKIVEQDKDFYDSSGGGMTISGGELLMHGAFVEALISIASKRGIRICLDTSGHGSIDLLLRLAKNPWVTDILYDMKNIDDEEHRNYVGVSNELILSNLVKLAANPEINAKIQMRMPLIHHVNEMKNVIDKTCDFYRMHKLKKVTLIAYHPLGISKMQNIGGSPGRFEAPSIARMEEIKRQLESIGVEVSALGNFTE
jgi:pyruvate formate lyase activating enzyme